MVPNRRLVFTAALGPGYRPQAREIPFTAIITLEPRGKGTRYHVLARHKDEATAKQHVEMGFHAGWSRDAGPARRDGEHRVAGAPKPDVTRGWPSYSLFGAFRDMIDVKERPGEQGMRAVLMARRTTCSLT